MNGARSCAIIKMKVQFDSKNRRDGGTKPLGSNAIRSATSSEEEVALATMVKRGQDAPVARALTFASSDALGFVEVCYYAILGRAPDPRGLASYAGMIAKAPDRETLIAVLRSIAMSEEAREYREHYLAHR